jgi:hypothetical protein
MMRNKVLWSGLAALFALSLSLHAVRLDSFSVGFHAMPSVERIDRQRQVDLSVSLGVALSLDSRNRLDLMTLLDSRPSSLGVSAQINHWATETLQAGAGISVFWPITEELRPGWPLLGTYVHATHQFPATPHLEIEVGGSFQLLTVARLDDRWRWLPLVELPTFSVAANLQVADQVIVQPRITVQPILTDATVLEHPIGRIGDHLLLLPTASVFLRHMQRPSAPASTRSLVLNAVL